MQAKDAPAKPDAKDLGDGRIEYTYPDGRTYIETINDKGLRSRAFKISKDSEVVVREGQGKDIRHATRIASDTNDKSLFLVAIMAIVTTIDGKGVPYELLDELPSRDYSRIQAEVSDLNF